MQGLPHSAPKCARGELPQVAYAAILATKEGPLNVCHLFWNNEAKSRPIDRPQLATLSSSAKGQTTSGQEGAITFGRANINLPNEHRPAEP